MHPNDSGVRFYCPLTVAMARWGEQKVDVAGDGRAAGSLAHVCVLRDCSTEACDGGFP